MKEIESQFDRLPPHSIEAERCLVASMLIERKAIGDVLPLVDREAFYQTDHQIYFDVISELHRNDKPIDAVIVRAELQNRQKFEEAGGTDYLTTLLYAVPSAAHIMQYAKIVREHYIGRCLIATANDLLRKAYAPFEGEGHYVEMAQKFERRAAALAVSGVLPSIINLNDAIEALRQQKEAGDVRRIPTELVQLDKYIGGGIPVGKWTLIAGQPGMGKSQLAKQIIKNVTEAGRPAALISLEEDRLKIAANMIANITGLNNDHITCAKWGPGDFNAAADAMGEERANFHIEDSCERLSEIEATVTQAVLKNNCELVVIDHIHLIDAQVPHRTREQQVALISRTLKMLAKRLDIALIGLCQLNRGGGAQDHSRPPVLRDLRDSGSLEQDGDLILMLHRLDYFHEMELNYTKTNKIDCYVNKQKDGPKAVVPLLFDGDHQRITDWIETNAFDTNFEHGSPYVSARQYGIDLDG